MQALGWRDHGWKELVGLPNPRYHALQDDLASVAYWYQTLPHAPFPMLPDREAREIIQGTGGDLGARPPSVAIVRIPLSELRHWGIEGGNQC